MRNINTIYRENLFLKSQINIYKTMLEFSKRTVRSSKDFKNLNYDIQDFIKSILKFDLSSFYIYDEYSKKLLFESSTGFDNSDLFLKTLDIQRNNIEICKTIINFEFESVRLSEIPHFVKNIDFFNKNSFLFTKLPVFIDNLFYGVYYFYSEKNISIDKVFNERSNIYHYNQLSQLVSDRIQTERTNYLSKFDSLTELYNRSFFEQEFSKYKKIAMTKRQSFCLVLIDINKLKSINDNLGHLSGDFAIKKFSESLKTFFSPHNIVARYGGDEFVIILGNSTYEKSIEEMENFRKKFVSNEYVYENNIVPIRFSYGIACSPSESMILHILLKIADERMYEHKKILLEEEKENFNFTS